MKKIIILLIMMIIISVPVQEINAYKDEASDLLTMETSNNSHSNVSLRHFSWK